MLYCNRRPSLTFKFGPRLACGLFVEAVERNRGARGIIPRIVLPSFEMPSVRTRFLNGYGCFVCKLPTVFYVGSDRTSLRCGSALAIGYATLRLRHLVCSASDVLLYPWGGPRAYIARH